MLVLEIQIKWLRKFTWICELLHKKKKAQPADEEILRLDVSVGEEQNKLLMHFKKEKVHGSG